MPITQIEANFLWSGTPEVVLPSTVRTDSDDLTPPANAIGGSLQLELIGTNTSNETCLFQMKRTNGQLGQAGGDEFDDDAHAKVIRVLDANQGGTVRGSVDISEFRLAKALRLSPVNQGANSMTVAGRVVWQLAADPP